MNTSTTQPDTGRTFTHPAVFTVGVRDGWADPETDPTRIDWPARQAAALIAFQVVDGRPVNPARQTGIRHGRNECGHWGEKIAADALVIAYDGAGQRWIVMIDREDGHGWALPGGGVDPREAPVDAAVRELAEETGLRLPGATWQASAPRYVPDPRASDEAWMVTVVATTDLGTFVPGEFPAVAGADDAADADWIPAASYSQLEDYLAERYGGRVFDAHRDLLVEVLDSAAGAEGTDAAVGEKLTVRVDSIVHHVVTIDPNQPEWCWLLQYPKETWQGHLQDSVDTTGGQLEREIVGRSADDAYRDVYIIYRSTLLPVSPEAAQSDPWAQS